MLQGSDAPPRPGPIGDAARGRESRPTRSRSFDAGCARGHARGERQAGPLFARRGQLLPRERVARLLDPGVPFLELSTMAGWRMDRYDPETSIPGAGSIVGIGVVAGTRVLVVADDAGIDAGALQPASIEKMRRAQEIARAEKLPFVHLVESAGANLLTYRVEQFIHGGGLFCNLARLSAAGVPVISVVHGPSTAGGASTGSPTTS